jgi:hypothetical protein
MLQLKQGHIYINSASKCLPFESLSYLFMKVVIPPNCYKVSPHFSKPTLTNSLHFVPIFNNCPKRSSVLCKSPLPFVQIRTMRRFAKDAPNVFNEAPRAERLSYAVQSLLGHQFNKPLASRHDIMERNVEFFYNETLEENVTKQTLSKGLSPRMSFKKNDMVSMISPYNRDTKSPKVFISNPNEKSDVRFIPEHQTANRFAKTSDSITRVTLNSEQPTGTQIDLQGEQSNKHFDLTLYIGDVAQNRDIKAGNNMSNLTNVIAEIPYDEKGNLYLIMKEGLSLDKIQQNRINYFTKDQNIFRDLQERIKRMSLKRIL